MPEPSSDGREAEREEIAQSLTSYLEIKTKKSPDAIQRYAASIRSGEHDGFMYAVAHALRTQSQRIMEDLAGEAPAIGSGMPDLQTLLSMEDANDRLRAASAKQGQPRTSKDSSEVISSLEEEAKSRDVDPFIASTEPYPPCAVPLESLEVIKFSQLTMETHHRGKALFVERIGPVAQSSIVTLAAVKDVDGDVEDIEIYHADLHVADALPPNTLFFVKEPYLTANLQGTPTIRVDHPSDIVAPDHLPPSLANLAPKQAPTRSALEWKEAGNEYYRQKQHFQAAQAYRSSLDAGADGKFRLDVCRNLAAMELLLGCNEDARKHAISALSGGSDQALAALDVKAYFRAATASYHLRNFSQAEQDLTNLLELDADDTDGKGLLEKVRTRLKEQESGTYDFAQLVKGLSRRQPRVDIADYSKRTVAGDSKGRGRGCFATEDIQLGDLILCEKAFCATYEWESATSATKAYDVRPKKFDGFPAALWVGTVQKLQQTPSKLAELTRLTGRYNGVGSRSDIVDGVPGVDAFQIHDILAANAFAIPTPMKTQRTEAFGVMKVILPSDTDPSKARSPDNCALFPHASLLNHSCIPNATRVFVGDAMVVHATRDIKKGEEIFHSYVFGDITEKQEQMDAIWGFKCDCKLCQAELKEAEDVRQRRAATVEEAGRLATDIITNLRDAVHRGEVIRLAERLHARLKGTFNNELYEGLPRVGMTLIQEALALVYLVRQEHSRCRSLIVEAFDKLGWNLTMHKATVSLVPKAGFETKVVEEMIELLAVAHRLFMTNKKDHKLAEQVKGLARKLYIMMNGVDFGIEGVHTALAEPPQSTKGTSLPLR